MKRHIFPWLRYGQLFIPETFEDCLTYGQRQLYMMKKIKELEEKVDELTKDKE